MQIQLKLPYSIQGVPERARKRREYTAFVDFAFTASDVAAEEVRPGFRLVGYQPGMGRKSRDPDDGPLFNVRNTIVYAGRNWMALEQDGGRKKEAFRVISHLANLRFVGPHEDPLPDYDLRDQSDDKDAVLKRASEVASNLINVDGTLYLADIEPVYRLSSGPGWEETSVKWSAHVEDSYCAKRLSGRLYRANQQRKLTAALAQVGVECDTIIEPVNAEASVDLTPTHIWRDAQTLYRALTRSDAIEWFKRFGHPEAAKVLSDMPTVWWTKPGESEDVIINRALTLMGAAVDTVGPLIKPDAQDPMWAALEEARHTLEVSGRIMKFVAPEDAAEGPRPTAAG